MKEPTPLGWKLNDDGNVVITMTRDDYDNLLLQLGAGAYALKHTGAIPLRRSLALLNRLNAGNPHYTPYEVEPTAKVNE